MALSEILDQKKQEIIAKEQALQDEIDAEKKAINNFFTNNTFIDYFNSLSTSDIELIKSSFKDKIEFRHKNIKFPKDIVFIINETGNKIDIAKENSGSNFYTRKTLLSYNKDTNSFIKHIKNTLKELNELNIILDLF